MEKNKEMEMYAEQIEGYIKITELQIESYKEDIIAQNKQIELGLRQNIVSSEMIDSLSKSRDMAKERLEQYLSTLK